MKTLRELYVVGSGPSSSHTIGPEKASKYMKDKYPNASFKVYLYGSLALTGKGHLTDYIILKTLGEDRTELYFDLNKELDHPNTFLIQAYDNDVLIGEQEFISVGGGALKFIGTEDQEIKDIYPFNSFKDIVKYVKERNIDLAEVCYEYEDSGVKTYLLEVYNVMKSAIKRGLEKDGVLPGKLRVPRKAYQLKSPLRDNESQSTKERRILSSYAYAVSEENASGGTIVTAPTCGACGILPAVLLYLQETLNLSDDKMCDALAVASLFGNLIKKNASISGAFAGCQAEVGSACSMAAAASAYLYGLNVDQIGCAAEIAMEHFLGLTCDPIDGLVQIPCIERNAVAALRAIDASMLAEYVTEESLISFDTVIHTMYETGKDLKQDYRETAIGGLAKHYKC